MIQLALSEANVDPWYRVLLHGIFLAILGVGLAWAGLLLFTRLTGWTRWLATLLALAGAVIFLWPFAIMFDRIRQMCCLGNS